MAHERMSFLAEIEAFLARTGLSARAFGSRSLNDPTLIWELRRGRECKENTRARIRQFIRTQEILQKETITGKSS